MRNWPSNEKAIIIDTEMYAGNFEREMVAFITGQIGECGVGEEAAEVAKKELPAEVLEWFEGQVVPTPDDHGVFRPASISPTPGWSNNGRGKETKLKEGQKMKYPAYLSVEFVVNEWPSDNIMEVISSRAKTFCQEFFPKRSRLSRFSTDSELAIPLTGIRWAERTVTETTVKQFGV